MAPVDNPGPILDYASPRPQVYVRLPVNSILRVEASAGQCLIVETLSGQGGAVVALIFSAFVLAMLTTSTLQALPLLSGVGRGMLVALALSIIALSVLVIRNTWRKTVISIANGEFIMTSTAPFTAARRYTWLRADIADVRVVSTYVSPTGQSDSLAELRVFPTSGPEIHLFTDHSWPQLQQVATAMLAALYGDVPPPQNVLPVA